MEARFCQYIHKNVGQIFYTVTDLPFTYELRKKGLYISRVRDDGEHTFTYENLQKAFSLMPMKTVGELKSKGITGSSYCFAIIQEFYKEENLR